MPRFVRPADTHLHVHTYVLEGGSGWRGVPPPPSGGAAPPGGDAGPDGDALDGAEIRACITAKRVI